MSALLVAAVASIAPAQAAAALGSVQLTFEPGFATYRRDRPERSSTLGIGGRAAVGLTDRFLLQVGWDEKHFGAEDPNVLATIRSVGGVLWLDTLPVRPFVELALAQVSLVPDVGDVYGPQIVPELGVGIDTMVTDWLASGVVIRYLPLFETELSAGPAYATISARLAIVLGAP